MGTKKKKTKAKTKLKLVKKKEGPKADPWMQGFACAAGIMASLDGFGDNAREIIKQGGFSKGQLEDSGCEQYDIDLIYDETDEDE